MSKEKREDIVLIASGLYALVAGLAVTTAITAIVQGAGGANATAVYSPFDLLNESLLRRELVAITFFAFAIPFYHGAVLALAENMRSIKAGDVSRAAFDFSVLFVEAAILYALALATSSLNVFLSWLFLLLLIDIVWTGASLSLKWGSRIIPLKLWLGLNLFMIAYVGVYRFAVPLVYPGDELWRYDLLVFVSVVRTVIDYRRSRGFYFPK